MCATPNAWEVETGGFLQVQDQSEIHSGTLSHRQKQKRVNKSVCGKLIVIVLLFYGFGNSWHFYFSLSSAGIIVMNHNTQVTIII